MPTPPPGSRRARWMGLVSLAVRRTITRAVGGESRQVWLAVLGIAIPIALLVVVTSVSIGLGAETTVRSPDVDYWIVPETGSAQSAVVSVGGPRFGDAHAVGASLTARDDVTHATPVLVELLELHANEAREFVLVIGVVPRATPDEFAGIATAGLTPGDPHYANGSYAGPWTGEAVVSAGAGELLAVTPGAAIEPRGPTNASFTVVRVAEPDEAVAGQFPVMLVHLGELQAITGARAGDQADQFLVATNDPGVREELAAVYPRSEVLSRTGFSASRFVDSGLPLSMSLAALVVAGVIGVLFTASTLGLTVATDAPQRALLAALGFSRRSRAFLVASHALSIAIIGGALGVLLGLLGILATNRIVAAVFLDLPVAQFHPYLVPYGFGVALVIGLVTLPYLWMMGRRSTTIQDLTE